MPKKVRITLELDSDFIKRLNIQVGLGIINQIKEGLEQAPYQLLGWLVLQEAKGAHENEIAASIPTGNRADCPNIIHAERRVYEEGVQLAGPTLWNVSDLTTVEGTYQDKPGGRTLGIDGYIKIPRQPRLSDSATLIVGFRPK